MQHFLKIDTIKGESVDQHHQGEIEVLSWAWGLSAATRDRKDTGTAKSRGKDMSKVQPHDLTITHQYDAASPVLADAAISGSRIKEAWLTARKAGDGQKDFLKITMKDVRITGIEDGASADGIVEQVSMRPRWIAVEYRALGVKGELGSPVSFEWDIKRHASS